MTALLDCLRAPASLWSTPNFWFRAGDAVLRNPPGPPIEDLDSLPLFDYELFDIDRYLTARDGQLDYMSARGCPYRCAYCINHVTQSIYEGKGPDKGVRRQR